MRIAALMILAVALRAQTAGPMQLTLDQAERLAVQNSPRVDAAALRAEAAAQQPAQYRSALYPNMSASVTGAGATTDSRIAAGALNNPIIYSRLASGATMSQLLFDGGRTSLLVESAGSRARAASDTANVTRAGVLLRVHQAYFGALRARSVERVADQTVAARQLLVDQVKALTDAKLKSGLDLSFANVALSEAKLLLESARNEKLAADALLSAALGLPGVTSFDLSEVDVPAVTDLDLAALLSEAQQKRPEIAAREMEAQSARQFADAERKLKYPVLSAVGSLGILPVHVEGFKSGQYAAGGLNITLPFMNGGLFKAREAEAEMRARAAGKDLDDLRIEVNRAVRVAYLAVTTAAARVQLTNQLLQNARQSLDLARARYDLGLSSIVELSQAELAQTQAEIQTATARYDYVLQRSVLQYEAGLLR